MMAFLYGLLDSLLPFEWLAPQFMKNAFLAALLAAPLFGLLGTVVVSNHMAFFSDAIGHSALTGIAIGVLLGVDDPLAAMVLFSITLGFLIMLVKSRQASSTDTIIGVFSSTAVALGIVLLSAGSGFSKYSRYLIGDLLSITPKELLLLLGANAGLLFVWIVFYNRLLLTSVHRTLARSRGLRVFLIEQLLALVTAVIVTVSIRWTGLLVINSLLVLPAAAARMAAASSKSYVGLSVLFSFSASISGVIISYYAGSAAGATIVLVSAAIYALVFLISGLRAIAGYPAK